MRILVTGGSGFIGSAFIRKILSDNTHKVLNFDKLTYAANPKALLNVENKDNYEFIKGDICNASLVKDCLDSFRPNLIVHFAAESHVDNSIKDAATFIQTNIVGTYTLLNECLNYWENMNNPDEFKFIHISTDEVYGDLGNDDSPFDISTPYAPNSPYSASKASSDHFVRAWNKTYNLPTIITHCSNNFGPWQNNEKLIPKTIFRALNENKITIYGTGKNIRDWIYVDDHVDGIIKVCEHGKIGTTYNMGGDCELTNIDLVQKICGILDDIKPRLSNDNYAELIEFVTDRKGHDFRYAIDNSKVTEQLSWTPQTNFDKALTQTIQWYLKETV